jgi:transformation/transcription domain-associated protein
MCCAGRLQVRDLVESLSAIAAGDNWMAAHLWVLVFPIVWATLSEYKEQQINLAKPIIMLLSKEYHSRQANHRPNVVQVRPARSSLLSHHLSRMLCGYIFRRCAGSRCCITSVSGSVVVISFVVIPPAVKLGA